jgi:hypothetical protein
VSCVEEAPSRPHINNYAGKNLQGRRLGEGRHYAKQQPRQELETRATLPAARRRTRDALSAGISSTMRISWTRRSFWRHPGHDKGLGDILEPQKDIDIVPRPRTSLRTSSAPASSRSNRDIKEQETGVELLSKLVADRQLRQGGRQGQLYGVESAIKIRRYRYRYGQSFHQR